jgi:hypothetical protein
VPPLSRRSFAIAALLFATAPAASAADTESTAPPSPVSVAIGVKTGIIPPVLAVPEIVFHAPHFFFGAFGITTRGGVGAGGQRLTLGAEAAYEIHPPDRSTPYISASYFRYDSGADAGGFSERSDVVTLTGGYEWKANHLELQLGVGALVIVGDERTSPPCTGFCFDFQLQTPRILPTFDLAARFRF